MQNTLIIVESPNKAKKLNEMFAGRFKAIATCGHICDLPENPIAPDVGIDRAAMKGRYELTKNSKRTVDVTRVIATLKKYLKDNPGTDIYIASDDDREGESIGAFVAGYLGLKNPKRMRFNAITKEKIEDAYNAASTIDWHLVSSREARRLIDRIIGWVVSPILWDKIKQKGASAGRVQTAVEALVIERERKIRNHITEQYYTVHMEMGGWEAEWQFPLTIAPRVTPKPNSEYDIEDTASKCLIKETALQIAAQKTLAVESCTDTIETKLPPSPLYTISMIQIADKVLKWDAEKTMNIAQKLFEGDGSGHGHITYHRTDSPNIDPMAAEEIRAWLQKQGLPIPTKPNTCVSKNKQAQEGHEAIRPSYFEIEEAGATDEQRALYKLIRERAINSQLSPATYAVKRIILTDAASGTHKFTATARTLSTAGWLNTPAAKSPSMQDDEAAEAPKPVTLPTLNRGTMLPVKQVEVKTHDTKEPPRYTMSSLTSKLEKLSIGRPATMATLLKNVQQKGTILVGKDGKLEATKLAENCYDILYPRFTFAHIGYTAELERALDQIASGQLDGPALVKNVWDRLDTDCAAIADHKHHQN